MGDPSFHHLIEHWSNRLFVAPTEAVPTDLLENQDPLLKKSFPYPLASLRSLVCWVNRVLQWNKAPFSVIDKAGHRFHDLQKTLDSLSSDLHRQGVGAVKQSAKVIDQKHEDILFWQRELLAWLLLSEDSTAHCVLLYGAPLCPQRCAEAIRSFAFIIDKGITRPERLQFLKIYLLWVHRIRVKEIINIVSSDFWEPWTQALKFLRCYERTSQEQQQAATRVINSPSFDDVFQPEKEIRGELKSSIASIVSVSLLSMPQPFGGFSGNFNNCSINISLKWLGT